MIENALTVQGDGYTVAIVPDAIKRRDLLIAAAGKYQAVTDAETMQKVQTGIKALADLRNLCERGRKDAKAPVLEAGRKIDAVATDFVAPLQAEEKRLADLVASFVKAEQEKARRAAEEAARAERERREAELAAERERLAAERRALEAERAALHAQDEQARQEAFRAAQAAEAERFEAEKRAREAAAAAAVPAAFVAPVPMKGVSEVPDFEVTDIWAFAAKFPDLVNPPTPRRAEILAKLEKTLTKKRIEDIQIPGLRVFMSTKVRGVRL